MDAINQIEELKKKRMKWMEEREFERNLNQVGTSEGIFNDDKGKILAEITYKLTEKFKNEIQKEKASSLNTNEIKMEKTISKEIESNTCGICYEMMLPPDHSPILLFPCGHTFCVRCVRDHTKKNGAKCPFCRKQIASQAPNLSLQNLICTFTNNKHLLDKVKEEDLVIENNNNPKNTYEEENLEKYEQYFKICKMRYDVINAEKREIIEALTKLKKDQLKKKEVLKELEINKQSALDNLEKIKAELSLINDFIQKTLVDEENIQKNIETTNIKLELIDGTLDPIEKEKTKYELLIKALKNDPIKNSKKR